MTQWETGNPNSHISVEEIVIKIFFKKKSSDPADFTIEFYQQVDKGKRTQTLYKTEEGGIFFQYIL